MNKITKKLFFLLFFITTIVLPKNSFAADQWKCQDSAVTYTSFQACASTNCTNCLIVTDTSPSPNAPVPLPNPLTGRTAYDETREGIPVLLGKIINSVMGIIGSLALVMFIYGGATWMLSAGNNEQVTKGKNALIWATIGLVIIFTAYALVKFVLTTVTNG